MSPREAVGQQSSTDTTPRVPGATTVQTIDGRLVDRLPVDRIDSALILLPGVTSSRGGGLSLRGGNPEDIRTYLDGVPITPGYRDAIFGSQRLFPAPPGYTIDLGTNALRRVSVISGPLPARFGNAQGGVVLLESARGTGRFNARGSAESDAPFGSLHGVGVNRFQADGGAQLTSKLRVSLAGTLEGQRSAETGAGAERFPIFRPAGVDTTVAVPTTPGNPFSDTTFVEVLKFAVDRGQCDAFAGSTNPGIADNY
ncbi:MAG: TonB-dependent receptor plug domain-containing protein, partial [Gemmatimonadota bacterium]